MKRLPVTLTEPALTDIDLIADHIVEAAGSEVIAHRFVGRIKARCRKIGDVPRGGRTRDDLAPGLRTVPFEHSAVICYVISGDRILITNVFYGGQDFEAWFRRSAAGPKSH